MLLNSIQYLLNYFKQENEKTEHQTRKPKLSKCQKVVQTYMDVIIFPPGNSYLLVDLCLHDFVLLRERVALTVG